MNKEFLIYQDVPCSKIQTRPWDIWNGVDMWHQLLIKIKVKVSIGRGVVCKTLSDCKKVMKKKSGRIAKYLRLEIGNERRKQIEWEQWTSWKV